MLSLKNKKGQVTIFIIIAILIIAAVLFIFVFQKTTTSKIPIELQDAENTFLNCVNIKTDQAIKLAEIQGGWLELPKFDQGSAFMPFSNYFNFLGNSVPYWFYVSGNGFQKSQFPSKQGIEEQISSYLENEIITCQLDMTNYDVEFSGQPNITTTIKSSSVDLTINWQMKLQKNDTTSTLNKHELIFKTNFGSLYDDASKIFESENSSLILEQYTFDVLNLYAPTTRVELGCSPKTWQKSDVMNEVKDALSANIAMIKFNGNYFNLKDKTHKYFVTNTSVDNQINLLYNKNWPTRFEVWPSEGDLLKADPVGTQAGLGIMGFCYVSYHFVYDLAFPVLVQVSKNNEIFQFPVIVVIDKNVPGKAEGEETSTITYDMCENRLQKATVITSDKDNSPVEADIYFKCINQICYIGKTQIQDGMARLTEMFPECFTGTLIAKNDNYEEAYVTIPSNEPFVENLFLDRNYELELKLDLQVNEKAIITFESRDKKLSLSYPDQNKVKLSAQEYNISVQLFKETNLEFGSQSGEKCITIPGIGFPYITTQQCFDITVPEQSLTDVIFGGGSIETSFNSQELASAKTLEIIPEKFNLPNTLEGIASIYELLDISDLQIQLK